MNKSALDFTLVELNDGTSVVLLLEERNNNEIIEVDEEESVNEYRQLYDKIKEASDLLTPSDEDGPGSRNGLTL